MTRSETTKFLSRLLEKSCFSGPGKYWAREVSLDYGYMQLNVDIDTKNIDLEEYVSMQKKSIADMCNVPEEKVIPISRLEYETYTDE